MKKLQQKKEEMAGNDEVLAILEKDWQEITPKESRLLMNKYYSHYNLPVTIPVSEQKLFRYFLMLKRKKLRYHQAILISPKPVQTNSVFTGSRLRNQEYPIPTWEGVNKEYKGVFFLECATYLPLLTVVFKDEETLLYCISPDGNFCEISDKNFDFTL